MIIEQITQMYGATLFMTMGSVMLLLLYYLRAEEQMKKQIRKMMADLGLARVLSEKLETEFKSLKERM